MVEQLELFEQRLPRKPYCSDSLVEGVKVRPERQARKRRFIQVNPPWLRSWLIFDVDRETGALAWEDAGLPEPYWSSQNPANGHAHLAFGLEAPVLLGKHDRAEPMRYLAAVETAMRAAMGADPGYSGLITKNPLHSHWRTLWSYRAGVYDLDYLTEHLDLPKFVNRKRDPEEVGLGRNVTVFDWLRYYAYRSVKGWKRAGGQGVYVRWQAHLYDLALQRNGEFPQPMDHKECYHIAKSVAHWVWTVFDPDASDERFSRLQSYRGKQGGRPAMADAQASAQLLRAQGMSNRAIARELGVDEKSVRLWVRKKP